MKRIAYLSAGFLLLCCSSLFSEEINNENKSSQKGSIQVLSAPELFSLTTRWAEEYSIINPGMKIKVLNTDDTGARGFSGSGANFGFVMDDYPVAPGGEPVWKMAVGRDVIVPILSAKNPFAEEIVQQGIAPEKLSRIFVDPGKRLWSSILDNGQNVPVHIYILNDETVISAVKEFLSINQLPVDGIYIMNGEEMIASIQNDPYAVGFCKVATIRGTERHSMVENIKLLPIDKNGNGRIDYMEKIYDNLDNFNRGVWIGKYPKALYNDVYCVAASQPEKATDIAFIKWVLTGGQQFLPMNGYCDLVYGEKQSKLAGFNDINIIQTPSKNFYFLTPLVFIILASIILVSLVISVFVYYRKNKKISVRAAEKALPYHFIANSLDIPKGLFYDKTHTWAYMEKDGMVKIGIDDFLQHVTGPVTSVQMRKAGEKIRKGDMILSIIQNGKRLIVSAPVSGTIIENNKILTSNSSIINSSPYFEGWVYRIEPANWLREIQFMDMAEKYRTWLNHEFSRLKDFLALSIKVDKSEYESVVLQDGGVLKDNILEEFGPEVWEDFQAHFLDTGN